MPHAVKSAAVQICEGNIASSNMAPRSRRRISMGGRVSHTLALTNVKYSCLPLRFLSKVRIEENHQYSKGPLLSDWFKTLLRDSCNKSFAAT